MVGFGVVDVVSVLVVIISVGQFVVVVVRSIWPTGFVEFLAEDVKFNFLVVGFEGVKVFPGLD